jgi:putative ABC transport system ATP-binding protein
MLFESRSISYAYPGQKNIVFPDITLQNQESCLILGKSGSGKTTLLNILAGLLAPKTGKIHLAGIELTGIKGQELDLFRGREIGIVFQKPHLLAALTTKENLQLAHFFGKKKGQNIDLLLAELGLTSKANSSVLHLSEGEAQRVSIARALANDPKLILADEPTASLDDENAQNVIQLLQYQASKIGAALIIVTHDQRVKSQISNFIEIQEP